MAIHEGIMRAVKDDARRAGDRDRALLEARRARGALHRAGTARVYATKSYRFISARFARSCALAIGALAMAVSAAVTLVRRGVSAGPAPAHDEGRVLPGEPRA